MFADFQATFEIPYQQNLACLGKDGCQSISSKDACQATFSRNNIIMGSANVKAAYKTNQNYIDKYNIDKASHSLN